MVEKGNNAIGTANLWFVMDTHHQRNAWPINVRIQKTSVQPRHAQRHRDIGRHCALAYAALTTSYGDNILYAWQRRRIGARLLRRLGSCWRLLFAAHFYLHRPNAGKST